MPAAAVIPAPIAYINVVAVKKLVVGFLVGAPGRVRKGIWLWFFRPSSGGPVLAFTGRGRRRLSFTVNKLECSKQGVLEYISME